MSILRTSRKLMYKSNHSEQRNWLPPPNKSTEKLYYQSRKKVRGTQLKNSKRYVRECQNLLNCSPDCRVCSVAPFLGKTLKITCCALFSAFYSQENSSLHELYVKIFHLRYFDNFFYNFEIRTTMFYILLHF